MLTKTGLVILLLLTGCVASNGAPTPSPQNQHIQSAPANGASDLQSSAVQFKVQFPSQMRLQCASCRAYYARLQIKGTGHLSTPIYALGADENGYVALDPSSQTVNLSAQVPEGNNWAAFAGLYANNLPNQQPLTEVGGVFHHDGRTQAQVELDLRALQTARIIDAMHQLGSPKLFQPLDLQAYQAVTDALLGVQQQPDGNYTFQRMPALDNPNALVDATTLAQLLESGDLNPQQPAEAANLPIAQLLPEPKVTGSYRFRGFTAGLSKLVMNPQGQLFSFDITQNSRRVYGLQTPDLNSSLQPFDLGELRNIYFSLGHANPSGQAPQAVIYSYAAEGVDRMVLRAYHQSNGQLAWSYHFENTPALRSDFVPVVWQRPGAAAGTADNQDRVFVSFNADPFNHQQARGVYAIENGQKIWHQAINQDFNNTGALSADGSQLYLISRSDPLTPSRLYALSTDNGQLLWEVDLQGESFTTATPVVGSNGDIYTVTFKMPANYRLGESLPGVLHCISSTGQTRWQLPLASSASFPPVVDNQQGSDMIYLITDRAQVLAVQANGQPHWSLVLPGTAGEGPVDSPLLAEDLGNGRTLYLAVGNGLIYAVKVLPTKGEMLWAQAPGAKVSQGMVLKDGRLFAPTLDGGEGQWVQIKAVQVHSQKLPATAPWPIRGGNLAGSGISHLSTEE